MSLALMYNHAMSNVFEFSVILGCIVVAHNYIVVVHMRHAMIIPSPAIEAVL